MERVSFEIERQDVVEALHAQADAAGRTVAAELAALVEQTYAPATSQDDGRERIERLIRAAAGVDFEPPPREAFIVEAPNL